MIRILFWTIALFQLFHTSTSFVVPSKPVATLKFQDTFYLTSHPFTSPEISSTTISAHDVSVASSSPIQKDDVNCELLETLLDESLRSNSTAALHLLNAIGDSGNGPVVDQLLQLIDDLPAWTKIRFFDKFSRRARRASLCPVLDLDGGGEIMSVRRKALVSVLQSIAQDTCNDDTKLQSGGIDVIEDRDEKLASDKRKKPEKDRADQARQRMVTNDLNQKSLLEYRLELERTFAAAALKLESEKKIKQEKDQTKQTRQRMVTNDLSQRALLEYRLQLETTALKQDSSTMSATNVASNVVLEEVKDPKSQADIENQTVKSQKKVVKKKSPGHKNGVFSPLVFVAKDVMGANELKKFRAEVISYHSNGIKNFVDTYESAFGQRVVEQAFKLMDENNDGVIDDTELIKGLHYLGFSWMDEKQIKGIMKKADKNKDGVLEFDEFNSTVSKILKTNLMKLAKQNGDDMGLLV